MPKPKPKAKRRKVCEECTRWCNLLEKMEWKVWSLEESSYLYSLHIAELRRGIFSILAAARKRQDVAGNLYLNREQQMELERILQELGS